MSLLIRAFFKSLINSSWIIKKIADYMKANKKKGSIINLGSIYGFLGQDLSIYKNTKMRENQNHSFSLA